MDAEIDAARAAVFPESERSPVEAALGAQSPERRGTLELVEIVAGGRAPESVRRTAGEGAELILRRSRASAAEWRELLRIPSRAAWRLACAFELGRRVAVDAGRSRAPVRAPRDAFLLVAGVLVGRERETVVALYLDARHRLLARHEVSVGTATSSLIHPREVFGPALRCGACAVVLAHNHPSGDPEPSVEDHGVTERLVAVGELVGVPLLDHLVVGGERFVSLRGRNEFPTPAQGRRVARE